MSISAGLNIIDGKVDTASDAFKVRPMQAALGAVSLVMRSFVFCALKRSGCCDRGNTEALCAVAAG
ncbi:MAG: hypothetical protein P4L40_25465 [Terracidiphilus sp.]|nr:hypothetical protein [Terracidiphilus sp.]